MTTTVKITNLKDRSSEYLRELEDQLKKLWSDYVKRLEENGFDETTKALKERYFNTYRCYRHNKKWREVMNH